MLDFFWDGYALDLVAFTLIVVVAWIVWAHRFNR